MTTYTPDPHDEVRRKLRIMRADTAAKAQATASNAASAIATAPAAPMARATQPKPEPRIQTEQEVRWEAADIARDHFKASRKPIRVMTHAQWLAAGEMRAKTDGCTVIQGRKREGYLHPYLNEADPLPMGTPGAVTSVKLTRQQLADKSAAWAKAKGIPILQAVKEMGIA